MTDPGAASTATLQLPEVLDLNAAGPLTAQLLALRGLDVVIDASRVQRLGGQCLQVLLSGLSTWAADGASLVCGSPSPEFIEGLESMGVNPAKFVDDAKPHGEVPNE